MRNAAIPFYSLLFALTCTSLTLAQPDDEAPESPFGFLNFETIHMDGSSIQRVVEQQVPGEMVELEYEVVIPFMEDGETRMRTETHTRSVPKTARVMQTVNETTTFHNLAGEEIDRETLLPRIPMTGLTVVAITMYPDRVAAESFPEFWSDVLRDDIVIMKIPFK